jgi:membrane-associated phospholipid phosphatase
MKINKLTIQHLKIIIVLFLIYMISFIFLEKTNTSNILYTSTFIDEYFPFNEYFVIFYISWYVYILLGFTYFIFQNDYEFKRCCFYMFFGMFMTLIFYYLFPNGQDLRVNLDNNNFCQFIINIIYTIDTPTNVCPSLHVYNSIMMYISLYKSSIFQKYNKLKYLLLILVILICLSTLFIKQHTFIDIVGAIILCFIVYIIGRLKFKY